jgi:hypothetical protein
MVVGFDRKDLNMAKDMIMITTAWLSPQFIHHSRSKTDLTEVYSKLVASSK